MNIVAHFVVIIFLGSVVVADRRLGETKNLAFKGYDHCLRGTCPTRSGRFKSKYMIFDYNNRGCYGRCQKSENNERRS